ncbi:hypothetical protein [Microbacterium telephonicum]|uniref:Uncharacterized protein n=1 Tax=Microbacterium telephonicum TaxID=1714841 RepID=A0A498BVM2_9MICO|nr:hypothetical protein [Microbacterium telephonicum]RLK47645.1 hypothetical protein C7474_2240 [Microbacterium telephonicum]
MSTPIMPHTLPPMLYPDDAPRVRSTDPITSSEAADRSVDRATVALWVEEALASEGHPMTADAIYHRIHSFGHMCSKERVRTVLNEGAGLSVRESVRFDAFRRLDEFGQSDRGRRAHLWTLAGGAA